MFEELTLIIIVLYNMEYKSSVGICHGVFVINLCDRNINTFSK